MIANGTRIICGRGPVGCLVLKFNLFFIKLNLFFILNYFLVFFNYFNVLVLKIFFLKNTCIYK